MSGAEHEGNEAMNDYGSRAVAGPEGSKYHDSKSCETRVLHAAIRS
jgi:hypothetical protein